MAFRKCQLAISKPNRGSERPSKAAGRVLRVLRLLRGAENVPDSSFEAQQKQLVGLREDPWQSSERPSKAAARVLRPLRVFKGHAENVPDSSFEAQQRQRKAVESCWEGFEGVEGFKGC